MTTVLASGAASGRHENSWERAIQKSTAGVKLAAGANTELIHSTLAPQASWRGHITCFLSPAFLLISCVRSLPVSFRPHPFSVSWWPSPMSSLPTYTLKSIFRKEWVISRTRLPQPGWGVRRSSNSLGKEMHWLTTFRNECLDSFAFTRHNLSHSYSNFHRLALFSSLWY